MGQTISKSNIKNFTYPILKQSNRLKNSMAKYPLSKEFDQSYSKNMCPIFSLRQKREIKQEELKKYQYKYEFKSDMTILTYNVWFESHNQQNRIKAIFSILKQSKADIICLQQVNSNFLKSLHEYSKDLTNQFDYFLPVMNMYWYDTLVLVKFPCKFYKIPFQSTMNRCDLLAVFQINNKQTSTTVGINTVHLQSLDNQKLRIKQLQAIQSINKKLEIVIIAGDFNFSDNYKENKIIQQNYIDIWKHTKSIQVQSYTMPATLRFDQWRPDHIIIKSNVKSNDEFLKNAKFQIERIGNFTICPFQSQKVTDIGKDNIVRSPSDHFGLFSQIFF